MIPETPDRQEEDPALIAYLQAALDELQLSPPEELLFNYHLLGWLAGTVEPVHWREAVDMAREWALARRTERL